MTGAAEAADPPRSPSPPAMKAAITRFRITLSTWIVQRNHRGLLSLGKAVSPRSELPLVRKVSSLAEKFVAERFAGLPHLSPARPNPERDRRASCDAKRYHASRRLP